jgi:hypothetical protein
MSHEAQRYRHRGVSNFWLKLTALTLRVTLTLLYWPMLGGHLFVHGVQRPDVQANAVMKSCLRTQSR